MTYEDGMKLFKSANYRAAAQQFQAVTELDENNHKAWNALGICLSKVGEYENAATCFENAATLYPNNAIYKKNQAGNESKRNAEPDLELDSTPSPMRTPVRQSAPSRSAGSTVFSLIKWGVGGIICLFLLLVIAAFIMGMAGSVSNGSTSSTPKMSATEIIAAAQSVPYEELARYPDKYKGDPVMIKGQVSQVLNSIGGVQLRMFTKQSEFSETAWFENDIFVDYPAPKEKVLEKDIVTIYGIADGIQDYTTVLGAQRSIPKIKAVTHTR